MAKVAHPVVVLTSNDSSLLLTSGSTLHRYTSEGSISSCSAGSSSSSSNPNSENNLIRFASLSNDGSHAATITEGKSLEVFDFTTTPPTLKSTRSIPKRASHITWSPQNNIIISDKVGDTYEFPLVPNTTGPTTEKTKVAMTADPSLNPDATLLVGHVSVITQHLHTKDGKKFITADRDEHIRISKYPESYVIDKYLFGSEGFVSAIYLLKKSPNTLLSAGGEPFLRVWDIEKGELLGKVGIWDSILPNRKVRTHMRKTKRKRRQIDGEEKVEQVKEKEEDFYTAPEGLMLPSGQGVCIKKIDSTVVEDKEIVMFFSEGCSAIQSFLLPSDLNSENISTTPISNLILPHPIIDFTTLPSQPDHILISLDTAWGILKQNSTGAMPGQLRLRKDLSEEEAAEMSKVLVVAKVSSAGEMSLVPDHPILEKLYSELLKPEVLVTSEIISGLQLYPLLPLLPRWEGMEEDDELAGPPATESNGGALSTAEGAEGGKETVTDPVTKRVYTREDLEAMNSKQLGRLKSQGIDIGDLLYRRNKKRKEDKRQRKEGESKAD